MGNNVSLTASELGYLWTGYAINEMSGWFLTVFKEHAKDEDIKNVYSYAIQTTNQILKTRQRLLTSDEYLIPVGFSDKDINLNAPPIFSDRFLLFYLYKASQLGLVFHARSFALAGRLDIRNYHTECLHSTVLLIDKVVELMDKKGYSFRTPHLTPPSHPEMIQKASYLSGWLGDNRPLNSMEIANHYHIIEILIMIETFCMGFRQTTSSEEIKKLLDTGFEVTEEHRKDLVNLLDKNNLPYPPNYKDEIIDSYSWVFSDRIILCHLTGLFGALISQTGFSVGCVMKHDLVKTYTTLITKAGMYTETLTRYLIEKEWLEKVPGSITR